MDLFFGDEKKDVLCNADVFIQPSRTEGQPVGLMEAIDIGVPCIVTKETNYGIIVEKEQMGWMVQTDFKDIANKIKNAYEQRSELEKYSENEKIYSKNNFEWKDVVSKTLKSYEGIIREYEEKNVRTGKDKKSS